MTDFSNINNSLNAAAPSNINISIVSLGGVEAKQIEAGMTVGTFKARYGLEGTKMVDESGNTLENSAVLSADTQVFVSTPKKNG